MLGSEKIAIAIVSYEELSRGRIAIISKSKTLGRAVQGYRHLHDQFRCFLKMPIVDFTEAAAVEFQRPKKAGLRIGTMDLRISAIALNLSATVLIRNGLDFSRLPGFNIEDRSRG